MELAIKRFDEPDERREFPLGSFELVALGDMTVGRASYDPGWRWSEHVGLVVSGRAAVRIHDGKELVMEPGDVGGTGRLGARGPRPDRALGRGCGRVIACMNQRSSWRTSRSTSAR